MSILRKSASVCFLIAAASVLGVAADSFDPLLPDDLVLKMPNGGRMVFRPIFLGLEQGATERSYVMGDRSGQYARERMVPVTVGGFFTGVNPQGKTDWLYYLGKYEVTKSQYGAVMDDKVEAGDVPMTNVERRHVENFLLAYNRWLLTARDGGLPRLNRAQAFLRLPNEEEWEFAARGGGMVSESDFEKRAPYPDRLDRYEWSEASSFNKLKKVGVLLPNPLHLYDMLGNASEMTGTPYQEKHGVGRVGGYVVRGGSFRNTEAELRASMRSEQLPMDTEGAPTRNDTIGFRLVIAAQAVPEPFPLASTRSPVEPPATSTLPPLPPVEEPLRTPHPILPESSRPRPPIASPTPTQSTTLPAPLPPAPAPATPFPIRPATAIPPPPAPPVVPPTPTRGVAGTPVNVGVLTRLATPGRVTPSRRPEAATKEEGYRNSLGMTFIPVPGKKLLLSAFQTRRSEYFAFAGRTFEDPEVFRGLKLGGDDTHPVISVSQEMALEFCRWLGDQDLKRLGLKVKYRLPTPEEWLAAGGKHRFPWGDSFPPREVVGNYGDRSLSARIRTPFSPIPGYVDGYITTAPVGHFPANEFGFFDLGSNVQEWSSEIDQDRWARVMGASWRSFTEEDLLLNGRLSLPTAEGKPFIGLRCAIELP